jgi:hypothetical protein
VIAPVEEFSVSPAGRVPEATENVRSADVKPEVVTVEENA